MSALHLHWADITYACYAERRDLRLDLYLPAHGRRVPLLIWIHGGAWMHGSKNEPSVLDYLPDRFALASIEYHFSAEALFPHQIHACKAAVRWLRFHADRFGYRAERIGVLGASAGGHLAALLGTSNGDPALEGTVGEYQAVSSDVQAVVDLFGPTDFIHMLDFDSSLDHAAADSPESRLLGGPVRDRVQEVAMANPITCISPRTCPFLILHGMRDDLIPWQQSQLLAAALQEAGVEVSFHLIESAGHGGPEFGAPERVAAILAFLIRTLGA